LLEKWLVSSKQAAYNRLINTFKEKWPILVGETAHEWHYNYNITNPYEEKAYADPELLRNLLDDFSLDEVKFHLIDSLGKTMDGYF
jgi:hypothetical protein